jgi:hypothetical protein
MRTLPLFIGVAVGLGVIADAALAQEAEETPPSDGPAKADTPPSPAPSREPAPPTSEPAPKTSPTEAPPKDGGAPPPEPTRKKRVADPAPETAPSPAPTAEPSPVAKPTSPTATAAPPIPPPARPQPTVIAPAPPVSAGAVVVDERLVKLNEALVVAMSKDPLDARELEQLCMGFVPRKLHELDPTLDVRLKLCGARAAMVDGRHAAADERILAALAAASAMRTLKAGRRLHAEGLLLKAERALVRAEGVNRCAAQLGLTDLRLHEERERSAAIESAYANYKSAVDSEDAEISVRALLGLADAAHANWKNVVESPARTYRSLSLPSPLFVEGVDATRALTPFIGKDTPWPREIDRLYRAALRAASHAGNDALVARVNEARTRHLAVRVGGEQPLTAPLTIPVGAIRTDGRDFYRRDADGDKRVTPSEIKEELERLAASAPLDDARLPFAMAALAELERPVPEARVAALLARDDLPSRLAALRVIEKQPSATHYEPVLAFFDAVRNREGSFDTRFSSLERALWGLEERALLAIRAIVARERALALKVTFENRLPLDERAWAVAELGDSRVQYRVQEMLAMGDDRAGAIALYGLYKTAGTRSLGTVRMYSRGLMGCVSGSIQSFERNRTLHFAPADDATDVH